VDNYYLNEAVYFLDDFLSKTQNPHYPGRFEYDGRAGHGWSPYKSSSELYREMAEQIANNAPQGENTQSCRYQ
jgi:hypothetical protein